MAATPRYKVYRGTEYVASVKYPEDGAAILAASPDGSTIRLGHSRVLFEQGKDGDAGESYDVVANICHQRE